jgi:hypothetical protein
LSFVDGSDDDAEEVVEDLGHLAWLAGRGQVCRAHQIDEQDRDLALVAGCSAKRRRAWSRFRCG